ncbi:MAG: histidinol-phosphate transaminase [Paludibacteraceae bacterium]|nr:histidinol-phosphate transaminase [Prevotellaceae bacterium]
MFELKKLVRPNIMALKPYSCARNEFKGEASVYLDANENPYNAPFNRYPDPLQWAVKEKISGVKGIAKDNIFLGNGSDEPIDLVYRAFCVPGKDNVVAIAPTYGMYGVCADINDIEYREILLDEDFQFSADKMMEKADKNTKVMWLCSPNNPTGNALNQDEIRKLVSVFDGIVILDEAYIDFSSQSSFLKELDKHPNLIVLQTFSKAWGSASIRLGMAFASTEIIDIFNKIKYPYNVNILTQKQALSILDNASQVKEWVKTLLEERTSLIEKMKEVPIVRHIYPTDANFILVKVDDANATYERLVMKGIIVRNRNNVALCQGGLRITVGTPKENDILINEMKKM